MEVLNVNNENTHEGNENQNIHVVQESSGQNGKDSEFARDDSPRRGSPKKKSAHRSKKKSKRGSSRSRKYHRRRKHDSESSSSDSGSSSQSSESESDDEPPMKRFKVITEEEKSKYKLPHSVADYINEHFEKYIPNKELKDAILVDNPVPENLDPVKKLDDFARSILKDSRHSKIANEIVNMDNVLEKVQKKIRDIMGPLSRMMDMIESATGSEEDKVTVSLFELKEYMEQTAVLVGQSSNTVSNHRRYNVLNGLMGSTTQAKELLREKTDLLQKHDTQLFGKKFRKHIVDVTKSKKTTIEAFSGQRKKSNYGNKPFQGASQQFSQQGRSVAGPGRQISLSKSGNASFTPSKQRWQPNRGRNFQRNSWQRNNGKIR